MNAVGNPGSAENTVSDFYLTGEKLFAHAEVAF